MKIEGDKEGDRDKAYKKRGGRWKRSGYRLVIKKGKG